MPDVLDALLGAMKRQSLENPKTPLSNPSAWLWAALGIERSGTGLTVSEQTALRFSAVYACVRIISEAVGSLPLHVYRESTSGEKKRQKNRREDALLHDEPNPQMSAMVWRETQTGHLALWGNAYGIISFNRANKVDSIWPLLPNLTRPIRDENGLRYETTDTADHRARIYPADEILHLPLFSFNGLSGLSPIRLHREAVALGLATEMYGAKFFSNSSVPKGVIEVPHAMSDTAWNRLKNNWDRIHQGIENASRTAILEEGAKWQSISMPNEDAQFLETRKYQVSEVARIYRIAPHLIGDLEKATFSNIEHQSLEFVIHCLRPYLVRWEQEINRKILRGTGLIAEHNVEGLLRGDFKTRMDGYAVGRQWGWLKANTICALENLPFLPKDEGETYLQPLNMIASNEARPTAKPKDTPAEPPANPPASSPARPRRQEVLSLSRHLFRHTVKRILGFDRKNEDRFLRSVTQAYQPVLLTVIESARGEVTPELETRMLTFIYETPRRLETWTGRNDEDVAGAEARQFLDLIIEEVHA